MHNYWLVNMTKVITYQEIITKLEKIKSSHKTCEIVLFGPCFVMQYLVSFLVLQSSLRGRHLVALLKLYLLFVSCGSSWLCRGWVLSPWLWHFPGSEVINFFHAQLNWAWNFICSIVGILTFMSRINFVLSWVEKEKKFYNLGAWSYSLAFLLKHREQ